MNNPKISVLMPVYNAEKFLKEAIDSVLNQTFKDFEFLIINDASIDNSKKIILSYKDRRIRYFENTKNLGVVKTLNKGLKLTKGEYIARMDADDISYIHRLKIEYDEIIKDDMVAIIASFYDVVDEEGKHLYTVKEASSAEEIYYTLQFRNCLGHSTVMFNKKIILNEFHGYKRCEAEDYELWLRVVKKYKIIKIRNELHKLRISNNSRVTHSKAKIIKSSKQIAIDKFPFLKKDGKKYNITKFLLEMGINSRVPYKIKEILIVLKELNTSVLGNLPDLFQKEKIAQCILRQKFIVTIQLIILYILNNLNIKILKYMLKKLFFQIKRTKKYQFN